MTNKLRIHQHDQLLSINADPTGLTQIARLRMNRKAICGYSLALVATGAILIPTVALGGARTASSHTVTLKGTRFHPGTLSINRGDSVRWVWRDDGENEHNVTFHTVHSRTQTSGSYTLRFTHSGRFAYRCTIHESEGMKGKIVVR
jgi:plastocyanin